MINGIPIGENNKVPVRNNPIKNNGMFMYYICCNPNINDL